MPLFGLIKRPKPPQPKRSTLTAPVLRDLPPPADPARGAARSPAHSSHTPADVRPLLLAAILAEDDAKLAALCQEHRDLIHQQAPTWATVPVDLRANPAAARWYARGMRLLASICADVTRPASH